MDILDFTKRYCGNNVLKYKQNTIDIIEYIEERLDSVGDLFSFSTAISACNYMLDNAIEVYDKNLPDYAFLNEVKGALNAIVDWSC